MLSARFELAIFRVSGERINQLSHESARLTGLCMLRANGSTHPMISMEFSCSIKPLFVPWSLPLFCFTIKAIDSLWLTENALAVLTANDSCLRYSGGLCSMIHAQSRLELFQNARSWLNVTYLISQDLFLLLREAQEAIRSNLLTSLEDRWHQSSCHKKQLYREGTMSV